MQQKNKQIVRQLDILRTLEANRFGKSARELAAEYKVDRRTIQRDVAVLREVGFWIEGLPSDQTIYYQLRKPHKLPMNFSPIEVAAMIFAERTGMGLVGTPFSEYLQSAISRLTQAMPQEMKEFLERATAAGARAQALWRLSRSA